MALGYVLFKDPAFGYFAANKVNDREYWFLSKDQIKLLDNIKQQKPTYGSLALKETGYFVMREGWEKADKMMVVSAGLDAKKPDHQHGDMLGIEAMANGHAILPNYQVRYSLEDFEFFKNSMVKNVALVDDELQGKQWTSNKGGSGFGKFKELPQPHFIAWESNADFDFFAGSHDGFDNVGVDYTRQVIFVKNEFWLVKDDFHSEDAHTYKQVWQGHYTDENGPNLIRAVAPDATGHDIYQLHKTDAVISGGTRGKQWNVVTKSKQKDYSFLTVIYPFKKYNNRLDETAKEVMLNNWAVNKSKWKIEGSNATILSSDKGSFIFNMTALKDKNWTIQSAQETDLFIKADNTQLTIHSIGTQKSTLSFVPKTTGKKTTKILEPGEIWILDL